MDADIKQMETICRQTKKCLFDRAGLNVMNFQFIRKPAITQLGFRGTKTLIMIWNLSSPPETASWQGNTIKQQYNSAVFLCRIFRVVSTTLRNKAFENIVEKVENTGFLPLLNQSSSFDSHIFGRLYMLSI